MNNLIKKIAIIVNYKNERNKKLADHISDFLIKKKIEILSPPHKSGFDVEFCSDVDFSNLDMALILGGDGTILSAARVLQQFSCPLLGINMGKLGFLSQIEQVDVEDALGKVLAGDYQIEERMLVQSTLYRNHQAIQRFLAFNDFVVKQDMYSRTIHLGLTLDGKFVANYKGDGIIVASPTGSTAYSLSLGGPLVVPTMDLMIINPVGYHSFYSRAIITPASSLIELSFQSQSGSAILVADGQQTCLLEKNDLIHISGYHKKIKMVDMGKNSFFQTVENKLLRGL